MPVSFCFFLELSSTAVSVTLLVRIPECRTVLLLNEGEEERLSLAVQWVALNLEHWVILHSSVLMECLSFL